LAILRGLDERLAAFPAAVMAMDALAARATRRREDAETIAVLARLKLVSLRLFARLLRGDGSPAALREEVVALEHPLRMALDRAWEPFGRERMMRVFYGTLAAAVAMASESAEPEEGHA
jgi:hypothetical protein